MTGIWLPTFEQLMPVDPAVKTFLCHISQLNFRGSRRGVPNDAFF
jgi:hypothetical protein